MILLCPNLNGIDWTNSDTGVRIPAFLIVYIENWLSVVHFDNQCVPLFNVFKFLFKNTFNF